MVKKKISNEAKSNIVIIIAGVILLIISLTVSTFSMEFISGFSLGMILPVIVKIISGK